MLNRRAFLATSMLTLTQLKSLRGQGETPLRRLVIGSSPDLILRTCARDIAQLLEKAAGRAIPVLETDEGWAQGDLLLAHPGSSAGLSRRWKCHANTPGSYRLLVPPSGAPSLVVMGLDPEGARNGAYALLEMLGFGFFRDGEAFHTVNQALNLPVAELESSPAFRLRGEMIWDFYMGPQRYCAASWGFEDWDRALLFMARKGMNFLEYYPPLDYVYLKAFPQATALSEGQVWKAEAKHRLAQRVLERGRALGIRFMYVLGYGQFNTLIKKAFPQLAWEGEFLCAHQPELDQLTGKAWQTLIQELGTDHLWAIRHRGEEGQSYSDPCRTVSKAEGQRRGVELVRKIDPEATVTVWTWAEKLPDYFDDLPPWVRAAHIRHGMGGVFEDVSRGREQAPGGPPLKGKRPYLSGQFTVFGGAEVSLQTAWSDATELARDARVCAEDPRCEGYFQWPEWANVSPWLSQVLAGLTWNPRGFSQEIALVTYAERRHGADAGAFLLGFRPLLKAGNARFMCTPRKRRIVPYFLSAEALPQLERVRSGLERLLIQRSPAANPFLDRDLLDLLTWTAVRQAHVFETAAYLSHCQGDQETARRQLDAAEKTWTALQEALALDPARSLLASAREMAQLAPIGSNAVERYFTQSADFYGGYPLIYSAESIELIYRLQCQQLRREMEAAVSEGIPLRLASPGWYWRDFPNERWEAGVRGVPRENHDEFRKQLTILIAKAFEDGTKRRNERGDEATLEPGSARLLPVLPRESLERSCREVLTLVLPPALQTAPTNLPPARERTAPPTPAGN